ncbi:NACHT, LRR and PYD domains-containing protein 12-like isoform X2 [Strongylocentrotus purpuratus]|uniref:NACHT domain-containing protein n=1 Tax=Strongylocentrotus purpuratus TaxID=7668 RepID=A0A7M7NB78_STRPU|nr:NACHT, LRR and PYD domains-containing protein 12-like isoform X2 [Strongylocentrotus purpuratus]
MSEFCLLYLLLLLLMRSGDVETNPGPNTAESTVSEMEFLKLARNIPPSHYEDVGISLGIPYAQLQAILSEKLKNYKNALMDVFMKWNVMQQPPHSNKRQLLAEKLREIDLGGLSDRLLNGPPISNSTGGPSRLLESQTKPPSAESETKSLSPELVERCAKDFKFKYRSTLCKIRADPLKPSSLVGFEKLHTSLVLEKEDGIGKQTLDYDNFLDLKVNREFPTRIMVQGEAGAGKTTFCAKIAWDWIEGRHFSHFVWVLIVPLREFKQRTIGEIAKSYLDKSNPATVSQIIEYIRSNPDKVFIAFDGLDEVSGKILKTKSHQSQPTNQMQLQPSQPSVSSEACGSSSEIDDIGLGDILCSDQLASCPVLVTTRPWRAVEIRSDGDLMKLYTFIHVEGFNRENLSLYIHKYFPKNKEKANQLIQFISENDAIYENMAHYPIYVAMLCLMWKELDKQKLKEMKPLKTFSQIFKEMIAFLKEHYAQKKEKKVGSPAYLAYLKEIDELLGPIAKQALTGLLENTLIFNEYDFKICPKSKDTACRVGILSQEDRITTSMDIHKGTSHVQLPVFFPHKLFQEYMAGVHLASLYDTDRNEFNRLIEEVVMPRKAEFRYLLYFTVSQNKCTATHVVKSMLQGLSMDLWDIEKELPFIVDVAFESQDPDVAALVKDRVASEEIGLTISSGMTAHTVAGYAFIGPHVVKLCTERNCGPTMSLDVAETMCSIPSLKEVSLHKGAYHHCFFETLAKKGKESKVQTLKLVGVKYPTPASLHHLVEALCSMPKLTDLTLEMILTEVFYSTLKAKASSIQVQTLELDDVQCPTPASSHHLVEALCSMPNLTDLKLVMFLTEEFYSTLKAKASSIKVQTLKLIDYKCTPSASSHHLAEALCLMPNLTDLTLQINLNEEFYSALEAKASSIQVHMY